MKTKTFTTAGALHPVLFFAGVYLVALIFSIFICSSLFYSCQSNHPKMAKEQKLPVEKTSPSTTTAAGVVMR